MIELRLSHEKFGGRVWAWHMGRGLMVLIEVPSATRQPPEGLAGWMNLGEANVLSTEKWICELSLQRLEDLVFQLCDRGLVS